MLQRSRKNWIAVASAEHALRGCAERTNGFMQVCHGKVAPLKRIKAGDFVTYYSPTQIMGGKEKCQSFVSIGEVLPTEPYLFDMGDGFIPWRRDVHYWKAHIAPIAPLIDSFEFVKDRNRWGYQFRFGLFEINNHDFDLIAKAMNAEIEMIQT